MKMLHHAVLGKSEQLTNDVAKQLSDNLIRHVRENVANNESLSVMTMATLLDLRFKTIGFLSHNRSQEAVRRLKAECSATISNTEVVQLPGPAEAAESTSSSGELWSLLDETVDQRRRSSNATADAIVEVKRYLTENNLRRNEDLLEYWRTQKHMYPLLYHMALRFL
ncbi:zinc finger BED domain-containing protein 1-like [Xyrichtys novacula]|uniref:Zinc finger BED domain-containing protein 1-like n=1 Tax=Xyrichtys novacula TaxID=13765 RepID=A0AAV1F3D7_XYRNO|nr:zinc finger BED domain-containing protein 1-like [Xyrichtys novacula]